MHVPNKVFMKAAIDAAKKAKEHGDYAIGAVVVYNDKIVARGHNAVKVGRDVTKHAEIVAIKKASKKLNQGILSDCILYTTHEPCPMCAAAAVFARMQGIVYGARMSDMKKFSEKHGNRAWKWSTIDIPVSAVIGKGRSKPFLIKDFMRDECMNLFHS